MNFRSARIICFRCGCGLLLFVALMTLLSYVATKRAYPPSGRRTGAASPSQRLSGSEQAGDGSDFQLRKRKLVSHTEYMSREELHQLVDTLPEDALLDRLRRRYNISKSGLDRRRLISNGGGGSTRSGCGGHATRHWGYWRRGWKVFCRRRPDSRRSFLVQSFRRESACGGNAPFSRRP
jgi:hypothetical protein